VLVSREEYVLGVSAVSCPVFDVHGKFLGVLAVLGLIPAGEEQTLASVVATIRELGARCHLGGAPERTEPAERSPG
jgi:DNA-binding IclR family transcriptional regulator